MGKIGGLAQLPLAWIQKKVFYWYYIILIFKTTSFWLENHLLRGSQWGGLGSGTLVENDTKKVSKRFNEK